MKANAKQHQRKPAKRTRAVETVLPPPEQRGLAAYAPDLQAVGAGATTAQAVRVPVELVDVPKHLEEIPLDEPEVRAISATVRSGGLIHPISLRPNEDGRFELVAGRHRLAAHKLVGLSEILSLIRSDWDDQAALVARAVENLRRRRLSPYEEARGYRDLIEAKLTPEQVADACQVKVKVVRDRLRLLALPVVVGIQVGTPEFPLSHADVLLQLVPYPEHFKAACRAIGKKDFDGRALTAHGFGDAVAAELRSKRLVQDLGSVAARDRQQRYPAFAKAVARLPAVKLGYHDYCVDPKAYRQAVAPYVQKDREAKEKRELKRMQDEAKGDRKESGGVDPAERQRYREFVEAFYWHEHAERIEQAAKGLLGIESVLGLLAVKALGEVSRRVDFDRATVLLAQAIGSEPSEIADVLYEDAKPKARLDFVERLCQHGDRLPLARFLATAALLCLETNPMDPMWEHVSKAWLGIGHKAFEKVADKAYDAWVKAGCGPLPWTEPEVEAGTEAPPATAAEPLVEQA